MIRSLWICSKKTQKTKQWFIKQVSHSKKLTFRPWFPKTSIFENESFVFLMIKNLVSYLKLLSFIRRLIFSKAKSKKCSNTDQNKNPYLDTFRVVKLTVMINVTFFRRYQACQYC